MTDHPHHVLGIVTAAVLTAGFVAAVVRTLTHNAEIRYWTGGAWAAFVNGFIEGCPVGSPAGAGIAAADGQVVADLGLRHLAIEAMHVLAVPFFTGLADVRAYTKANPFPNPFTAPPPAPPPPAHP